MAERMAKYIYLINRNRLGAKFNSRFNSKSLLLSRYIRKYVGERTARLRWKKKCLELAESERRVGETVRAMRHDYEGRIDNYLENIKQKNERLNQLKYDYDMICSEYDNVMSERDNVLRESEELSDKLAAAQERMRALEARVAWLRDKAGSRVDLRDAEPSAAESPKKQQTTFSLPQIKPFYSDPRFDEDDEFPMASLINADSNGAGGVGGQRYDSPAKLTKSNSVSSSGNDDDDDREQDEEEHQQRRQQVRTVIPIGSTSSEGFDREIKAIENRSDDEDEDAESSSAEYDLDEANNSGYTSQPSDEDEKPSRPRRRQQNEEVVFINPDGADDGKLDPNLGDLVDINKNHLVTRFRLMKTQLDETIRQRNEAITQIREMYQQMNMRNNLIYTTKLNSVDRARFEKIYRFAKNIRGGFSFERVKKELIQSVKMYKESNGELLKERERLIHERDSMRMLVDHYREERDQTLTKLAECEAQLERFRSC